MPWSPTSSHCHQPGREMPWLLARPRRQRKLQPREVRCNEYGYREYADGGARKLSEQALRRRFVAVHHRPQAYRTALPALDHILLLYRRLLRAAHSSGVADSSRRPGASRYLQQAVHHARHGDDFLFPDPLNSRRARELPRALDDRGERPGLPENQPPELVSLHHRRRDDVALHADRWSGYRLDVLRAFQHCL